MPDDFKTSYPSTNRTANPAGGGKPHGYTRKGREFATRLVESENYRKWIFDRIQTRTLDSAIERMLWAYAYGRPKEYIEVATRTAGLADAPVEVLHERAERLATLLVQLKSATTRDEAERLVAALAAEEPVH